MVAAGFVGLGGDEADLCLEQEVAGLLKLADRRRAGVGAEIGVSQPGFILTGKAEQALGEMLGLLDDEAIVQKVQGLRGERGIIPAADDGGGVWQVKWCQLRWHGIAQHEQINTAVRCWLMQGRQLVDEHIPMLNEGAATRLQIEPARGGEHDIAQGLGVQTAAGMAREEAVFRIGFKQGGSTLTVEPVSAAEHQSANELFNGPTFAHETCGQVVQQLRVGGSFTRDAEVIGRAHESLAKEMLPDAVYKDPGGERVLRAGEPFGQLQTAALLAVNRRGRAGHGTEKAARDGGTEFFGLPTDVDRAIGSGLGLTHAHRKWSVWRINVSGFRRRLAGLVGFENGFDLASQEHLRGGLQLMQGRLRSREGLMRRGPPERLSAFENARKRIVVPRGDGIGLVIVTARAADAQPEDATADGIDLIGDDIHLEVLVHGLRGFRADGQEAGGNELTVTLLGSGGRQQVPGDLLGEKAVIRQVLIEGLNNIIPVAPSVGEAGVAAQAVVAVRLRVTGHIKPMATPLFPKLRALQEAVHERMEGLRCRIGHGLSGGGQTGEVIEETPNKRARRRIRSGGVTSFFDDGQNKVIERILWPIDIQHHGRPRILKGRIRPNSGRINPWVFFDGGCFFWPGIGSTHFDPRNEIGNERFRQFLLGRHFQAIVTQRLNDEAGIGITRNDGGTRLAATDHLPRRIQQQLAPQLFGTA